jgi:hypothetical protein
MSAWPNTVTVGGFTADIDAPGEFRVTAKVTGWDDAPQVRSGIEDRSQQDGGWDGSGFYSSRVITLDGVVDAASHAGAQATADQLLALSPRTVHEFVVDKGALGVRSAMVRVTVGAVLDWLNGETFTYTLQLTAPDPLKYGPAWFDSAPLSGAVAGTGLTYPLTYPLDYGVPAGVTPGALSIPNAGTASYHPRIRIDGPVPNPVVRVAETGDWIRYGGTVPAGQHIDIDCAKRRVTIGDNPVSMRHLVTFSGRWCAIPTGGASLSWSADAADPAATMSVWGNEGAWS